MNMGAQTMEMTSGRSFERGAHEGRDAWVVVENARMPMGTASDTTWVDATTLRPLVRHVHQGPAVITLEFTDQGVTGSMDAGTQQMDVDVPSDEPLFGDGPSLHLAVGAMPLEEGYVSSLHRLNLMQGSATAVRVAVTGSETVTVPAGTFEAWVVSLEPDEGGESSTLWIDRDSRRVVRAEMQLGPQMGGGTATLELTTGL